MSIGSDSTLQAAIQGVKAVGTEWFTRAEAHHAQLTKPPGSLGLLESVGIQLSSIQETTSPVVKNTRVIVFAADHGITKHHEVGPYPREVTAQMVVNFIRGGAAINTFAGLNDADFTVVDMGVDADLSDFNISPSKNYVSAPVARGTADISAGPAMSTEQLSKALKTGLHLADECATRGIQAVALGEMGIGNTTIASAVSAALMKVPVAKVTGRGTGADDVTLKRKISLIERAIQVNGPSFTDGAEVLRRLGGFELAGIAGLALGLAKHRIAIVADGYISTAAVYAAVSVCPAVADYVVCGHLSPEPGHQTLMNAMKKKPLLDLGLRLGEGTGACLSLSLLKAAVGVMSGMATFAEAGVEDKA